MSFLIKRHAKKNAHCENLGGDDVSCTERAAASRVLCDRGIDCALRASRWLRFASSCVDCAVRAAALATLCEQRRWLRCASSGAGCAVRAEQRLGRARDSGLAALGEQHNDDNKHTAAASAMVNNLGDGGVAF
eukprot:204044-Pleurochrysis_carterae.AAC.1